MIDIENLTINEIGKKELRKSFKNVRADFLMPFIGVIVIMSYFSYRVIQDDQSSGIPLIPLLGFLFISVLLILKGALSSIKSIREFQRIVTKTESDNEQLHLCTMRFLFYKNGKIFTYEEIENRDVLRNLKHIERHDSILGNGVEFLNEKSQVQYQIVLNYLSKK